MISLNDTFTLYNGYQIPCIGFGTWQIPDGGMAIAAVSTAIKAGYRHIDTAAIYENERGVGEGIIASGIPRREIFVTSKLWNTSRSYTQAKEAFFKTLTDLQLDYLDLYLIHWPAVENQHSEWKAHNLETWRALEDLYKEGYVKAIGVSNFLIHHLEPLLARCEIKPMVNQIELHPGQMQEELVDFCKANDILVEGWSPLGSGHMLANETLNEIARSYHKSVAQLCIRWALQNNILPLPKAMMQEHIAENVNIFDFEIIPSDMCRINEVTYCGGSGLNPDEVDF